MENTKDKLAMEKVRANKNTFKDRGQFKECDDGDYIDEQISDD